MIPKSTSYQAACPQCCAEDGITGGKRLGMPSSKKLALRVAKGHQVCYGHKATIWYRA